MKKLQVTVVLGIVFCVSLIMWASQEYTVSGDAHTVCHGYSYQIPIKAFSCQGAELFAQHNKIHVSNQNSSYQMDGNSSSFCSHTTVGNCVVSCSIDPISCLNLVGDSLNIMSVVLKYFVKGCERIFESKNKQVNREAERIVEDFL